jgi:hypothetical protein
VCAAASSTSCPASVQIRTLTAADFASASSQFPISSRASSRRARPHGRSRLREALRGGHEATAHCSGDQI